MTDLKFDPDPWGLYEDDPPIEDGPVVSGPIVSTAELALHLDLVVQSINRLTGEGTLARLSTGRYDLDDNRLRYIRHLRRPTTRQRASVTSGLSDAKTRLALAQAELAEQKAAEARNELVPAVDVQRAWIAVVADLRSALLAVPSRVSATLGLDREAANRLDAEMRLALTAVADGDPNG